MNVVSQIFASKIFVLYDSVFGMLKTCICRLKYFEISKIIKRRNARRRAAVRGFSKSQLLRSKSYKETKGITLKPWT